ncbi:hypothetical protein [Rhodococcus sp. BS-15]|uniref:hypothetical protein n=1 Tax=Rhodococcus sp. BS-15 TaxID=1304954 RepID=UPI000ADD6B59|nr:hypothetical protein [Rhodococcus sp. BS-15]
MSDLKTNDDAETLDGATLDAESSAGRAEPELSSPTRRRPSVTTSVLAVLLFAVLAVAGLFAYQLENRRSLDTSRSEAVDTARTFAITLFTYSADTFDTYVDDVLSGATGSLADTFVETSSDLQATLVEAGATSSAQILDIAAKSSTLDRVEVLVIIDQTASNATVTEPRQAVNAVIMTLERQEDGRWLTSDVTNPSAGR